MAGLRRLDRADDPKQCLMPSTIEIPTALTVGETKLLQSIAAGKSVIEAGSLLGYSTVAMARRARQVHAIDPHDGYPAFAPRPTLDVFLRNIRRHGVTERVVPVVGSVLDVLPGLSADVCFLDLTGARELTQAALELALDACPVVAVHDYARGGCDGCTRVVDFEVRARGLRVTRVDTLVVVERSAKSGR